MEPMDLGNKASSNIKSSYSEEKQTQTKKANERQVFSESLGTAANGCVLLLSILDEAWCVVLNLLCQETGVRMMWRRKQEKKVKELKKGDWNKNKETDQVERFKNKCFFSPKKT